MIRPKLVLFLSYASIMMSAIFIPNYALALGASMVEIGLVGAAYGLSLFISSYIFSRASDIRGRKNFIIGGVILSATTFFLQIGANSSFSLIIIRGLVGFSLGVFTAPLIAYVSETGGRMGTFSSYGSLGWAAGGLLAGIIAQEGEAFTYLNPLVPFWGVFLISSLLFLASFLAVLRLPEIDFKPRQLPLFPRELFLKNFRIYLSAFLRHFGAYSIWIIFPLFLAGIGASKFWIGVLYFINMGGQAVVMRRLDFADEIKLIKAGLVLSSVVFFSYTLVPDFLWVIPLQALLAISYSFLYVGDLVYLTKRNEEKAISVGILNSVMGICIGLGPVLGGVVSQLYGFHGVMYSASILTFLGFLVMIKQSRTFL
jgi:MFS family permease